MEPGSTDAGLSGSTDGGSAAGWGDACTGDVCTATLWAFGAETLAAAFATRSAASARRRAAIAACSGLDSLADFSSWAGGSSTSDAGDEEPPSSEVAGEEFLGGSGREPGVAIFSSTSAQAAEAEAEDSVHPIPKGQSANVWQCPGPLVPHRSSKKYTGAK